MRRLAIAGCLASGLVALLAVRPGLDRTPSGPPPAGVAAAPAAGAAADLPVTDGIGQPRASLGPVPTALDAEWLAYSDSSTCADWAGADGVSAVRLSATQVAWFFSDSELGPAGPSSGFSHSKGLIHNSMVIQTLSGPGRGFVTLTGGGVCGTARRPAAVLGPPEAPGGRDTRYWGEDAIAIGDTIVKFYNSYPTTNAPYVPAGTVLAVFSAAQLSAAASHGAGGVAVPQAFPLATYTPPGGSSPIAWGSAVLRSGNTVYVYGTQTPDDPVPDRQVYLARVPASQLAQFTAWQFYAGSRRWTARQETAAPLQPPRSSLSVSSGFSVIRAGSRYWLIQADPIAGSQDIDAYPAAAPWGPFDQAAGIVLYRDPGIGIDAAHDYRIMYEARVITALSSSKALVIGYNVNTIGSSAGCAPMDWFSNTALMPRFISVPLAVFGAPHDGQQDTLTTGPDNYPHVAARDQGEWFNEWNYRNGCPPVPGVSGVQARARAGTATLSWPDAGLGLGYRVYLKGPGTDGYRLSDFVFYVLSSTTRSVSVTLSGLAPGQYEARVVPVNLKQQTGETGQVAFAVP